MSSQAQAVYIFFVAGSISLLSYLGFSIGKDIRAIFIYYSKLRMSLWLYRKVAEITKLCLSHIPHLFFVSVESLSVDSHILFSDKLLIDVHRWIDDVLIFLTCSVYYFSSSWFVSLLEACSFRRVVFSVLLELLAIMRG